MPSVVRRRDVVALGAQQPRRLQQLRDANDDLIHQQHLAVRATSEVDAAAAAAAAETRLSPRHDPLLPAPVSRTVEAIVEQRLQRNSDGDQEEVGTTATRLRERIRAARGGIQTERGSSSPSSGLASDDVTQPRLRQKIVAVRRYGNATAATAPASQRPRRLRSTAETEWLEKQALFAQRASVLEKDCMAWWHSFYASSVNSAALTADGTKTAMSVQKQLEEDDRTRRQETSELHRQLRALQAKCRRVTAMVHDMRDGVAFYAELQQEMDALEQTIATFRREQRTTYDHYAVEEKVLQRELALFLEKTEAWETQDIERKTRSTGTTTAASAAAPMAARRPPRRQGSDCAQTTSNETALPAVENELVTRVRRLNQQILASGGLKGGWDDREHAVFTATLQRCGLSDAVLLANDLRTRDAHDNQEREQERVETDVDYETRVVRFLRKCAKAVVTRSESAVRTHLAWYVSHVRLVQDKKEALERWRQDKEATRQRFIEQGLERIAGDGDGSSDADPSASPEKTTLSTAEQERKKALEAKERQRQSELLDAWRQEKEAKEQERREQEAEERRARAAHDAKRRQELLEKKQQVLLYRLQKEQDAQLLARNDAGRPRGSPSPETTRVDKAELERRSKMAIEAAKARRAKLEARHEQQRRQQELPQRPKSSLSSSSPSPNGSSGSPASRSPTESTLQRPTKAVEARHVSKLELRRQEKRREQQGAHERYIPGAGLVADAKLKSFGHVPIAPRAVPSWRRNLA